MIIDLYQSEILSSLPLPRKFPPSYVPAHSCLTDACNALQPFFYGTINRYLSGFSIRNGGVSWVRVVTQWGSFAVGPRVFVREGGSAFSCVRTN